jgi:hypothetical protein
VSRRLLWFLDDGLDAFVDVEEPNRKRLIREAEYQARADAESRVLRVKGQVSARCRRRALVERPRRGAG